GAAPTPPAEAPQSAPAAESMTPSSERPAPRGRRGRHGAPSVAPQLEAPPATPTANPAVLHTTPVDADVRRVHAQIAQAVGACPGQHGRHARAVVHYAGRTGAVTNVALGGAYFQPSHPIGACIVRAIRAVSLPPFRARTWATTYVFSLR